MFRRPQRAIGPSARLAALPAPTGGLNANAAAMGMPATDCMLLYNMLAADLGLRVRLGSREWVTGLTGAADNYVRTIVPYTGKSSSGTRLFVTTSSGIWNATSSTAAPSGPTVAFGTTTGNAGYGIAHAQTTTAGNFLYYADEANGLHLYTESTGLWTAPGSVAITGATPANIVFATVFKGFPFFAIRDSTDLYFLAAGTVTGAASRMGLGYKLQAGGDIVGMWSWTYDGGSGLDDRLVVVSRGGDVVVYNGTDPSDSTTFGIEGVWSVGKMPAGRNVATTMGGDLLLLTRSGIVSMSKLVSGRTLEAAQYETDKVQNLFNNYMLSYGDTTGWDMRLHPEESALIVTVPNSENTQLAMSLAKKSWGQLRGLPMHSCAAYEGKFHYGTTDGKVCINDGYVDGQTLADPNTYEAIAYSGVSAFQNLGTGTKKQVHLIRPFFMGQSTAPSFSVGARYDFNLTEMDAVSLSAAGGASWDSGVWDTAVWGGAYAASHAVRGASGMGSNIAIAWSGASVDRTVLTGFELSYSEGGML